MPRRRRVFGVPPSTIHTSVPPPSLGTSTWIQACGFTSSTLTILPLRRTGRFASNSAPNAWCARTGTAVANVSAAPAATTISLLFINIALSSSTLARGIELRPGRRFLFLEDPGPLHDTNHRVISLMARILVELVARLAMRPCVFTRPRLIPGRGILDREPVQQRFVVDTGEPLGHLELLRRPAEAGLIVEVCRFDDQRITFPAADRVAEPAPDVLGPVRRPIEIDDPHVVDHL